MIENLTVYAKSLMGFWKRNPESGPQYKVFAGKLDKSTMKLWKGHAYIKRQLEKLPDLERARKEGLL